MMAAIGHYERDNVIKRILATVLGSLALCALPAPAPAAGPVVLFDEGHRQQFLAGRTGDLDLSRLAAAFQEAGFTVRVSTGPLDVRSLRSVQALVISGAFAPLSPTEINAVGAFIASGGRLAVMLHIGQPVQGLLEQMGISYSRGPIHEAENLIGGRQTDFSVVRFERHPVTEGLRSLSVFGCWALRTQNPAAKIIARTGRQAWLDSNGDGRHTPGEPLGSEGMLVSGGLGRGQYLVFGDDAIFQNRFVAQHNGELARRLAAWLAGGAAAGSGPGLAPSHRGQQGLTDL